MNNDTEISTLSDLATEPTKIRIAYIIPRFLPFKGGAEQNTYALASRMAKEGHDVTVITTDVKYRNEILPNEEVIEGIKVVRIHAWNKALYAGFYPALLSYLWKNNFDVVHSSGIGFIWREFCLIIKKLRVKNKTKFIVTPHGPFMALGDTEGFRGFVKKYYTKFLKRIIPWIYDIVIQVSPKQKKWMVEEYGIKSENIRLIPNGINESYLESELIQHAPADKVTITYMNRMEWYKGIQDVIKALDSLIRTDRFKNSQKNDRNYIPLPELEFLIMGRPGNYTPKLKELVEKLKMEQYIKFIFTPSDEERDRIFYEESQINILPSKWEATGITLVEAMAKGNALVTTLQNEAAYLVIKEGINGFVYNFGDVEALSEILYKLLTDSELRQSMRKYNIEFASQFTWEAVFPNYLKLINEVVQEKTRKTNNEAPSKL